MITLARTHKNIIKFLFNEIEQSMLNVLAKEQLSQLRKIFDYTFHNVFGTEKYSICTESNNQKFTLAIKLLNVKKRLSIQ